jgi:hypothetical protein
MQKIILSISILLLTASISYAGGPWPQPKGEGYFKLSEWWIIFDQHYTDQGLIDPNVTNGIFNTSFYGEYGVTDRFTLVLNAPLFSRAYNNNLRSATTDEIIAPGDAINSIGDIDLGFKFGLTGADAKIPVALSLTLGVPTGNSQGGIAENLQTGDGEFNQLIQLDAGRGFNIGSASSYISAHIGFNNRTNDFSEEFRYGFEWGVGLFDNRFWLNTKINGSESFKNGFNAASANATSIFANNSEFFSIGVEGNIHLTENFGISAGVANAVRGEIIAAAPSYSVGVFYQMK